MTERTRRLDASAAIPCLEGAAVVHGVRGHEALSEPFRYEVDLAAGGADFDAVRGGVAHVELSSDTGEVRHIDGVLASLAMVAIDEEATTSETRFRAVVVPAAWLLTLRRGFRIFQDKSVPDIAKKVFRDAGLDDALFRWTAGRTYEARPYCVQYDESEWDFVSRLLEEEGIYYWFEHTADGHVMVFADASDTGPAMDPAALAFTHSPEAHEHGARVWDWRGAARATEDAVALRDYDLEHPSRDLHASATAPDTLGREWYDYPGRYVEPATGRRRAGDQLESLRVTRRTAGAQTSAIAAQPGRYFTLDDHPTEAGEFLVTAVELAARLETDDQPGALVDPGEPMCAVTLAVMPRTSRFRAPKRTPRPRVMGIQTARVTGPSGQEIYCDALGRVKVQFHWDREGQLDERSSCWLRVAQAHTTGAVMIPRVGWEVLVEFVDGDPDRPLCMGHVWNVLDPPQYALPAQKTVTGHKSNSSPGAAGVNEVRLDDASGAQEIAVNGHRDITVHAAHNKRASTTNNESRSVAVDQSIDIGADETVAVLGDDGARVGGSETVRVGGNRAVKVSADTSDSVTGSLTLSVGGLENLMVGNPVDAVLQVIASQAIAASQAAAGAAASRAQAALLGPLMPAVGAARQALGPASRFLGPSAGLLSGNPSAALGLPADGGGAEAESRATPTQGSAALAAQPDMAIPDPSTMAAGVAGAITSDALAALGVTPAGGGGGGGGDGGGGGSGTWAAIVGGNVTEKIGALAAINSIANVEVTVGGDAKDSVGAARLELVGGGRSESTGGAKTETVGVYMVNVSQGLSISAMAAFATNAASLKQKIGGSHSLTAKGAAAVNVSKFKGKASTSVTLKCGLAEVVIDDSGVSISGLNVTIEATGKLKLDPSDISPG